MNILPAPSAAGSRVHAPQAADPDVRAAGLNLLATGKVAVLMAAGGISTRMCRQLRGELMIGPVTNRTIFRLQGEAIAALQQRYAPGLPWIVLLSQEVDEVTRAAFEREHFFGATNVRFIRQRSFPVLDEHDRPVRTPGSGQSGYLTSPGGHGGMFEAICRSGELARLIERGIEYLFYFQYPNVLEQICDPVLLGRHHNGGAPFDVTTKAIARCQPEESQRMGRVVEVEGKARIIEYWDLSEELRDAPGSMGTHVWSLRFLDECRAAGVVLPMHTVAHREPDCDAGWHKHEQWIFDLLDHASSSRVAIASREDHFAPVKSLEGIYSLESARSALDKRSRKWLRQAGIDTGPDDVPVEISPLAALDLEDLKAQLENGSIAWQRVTCDGPQTAPERSSATILSPGLLVYRRNV